MGLADMGLSSWIWDQADMGLADMGLSSWIWDHIVGKQEVRILMLGLDAAGKTTILCKLKLAKVVMVGCNLETVDYKNVSFTVWDIGGQDKVRRLWRHYFRGTQGLIYVVDSADRERMDVAAEEFARILKADELRDVPLLVLANKQDLPDAMSSAEVTDKLGLRSVQDRQWFVQSACAIRGDGLHEGLDWLSSAAVKASQK